MDTILHGNLLCSFFGSQPKPIPEGTEYENNRWNSFWTFLKSKTDLILYNVEQLNDFDKLMLTQLNRGRGNARISNVKTPFSSHNHEIKCNNPLTFYCLAEEDEASRNKYRKKNGYLFAFNDDLFSSWEKLSLLPYKKKHSIRKDLDKNLQSFTSWSKLSDYLTPFTDVVIIDNYIFNDPSLIPSNLEKILTELDKATPVKYNVTIYTFEGEGVNKINGRTVSDTLSEIKERLKLRCNIELIIAKRYVKEHDRGIFTNYLTIRSGDSFNYFNSKGEIISKGTDLTFNTLADLEECEAVFITLSELSKNVNEIKEKYPEMAFGHCTNQLISKAVSWRKESSNLKKQII